VKKELAAEGLQLETFGGDVPCVEVSGLTGAGLDNLIGTISLVAEMLDIRAEREARGHGFVIESRLEKGLG
jgi:translation initiation factor IF-2